MRAKVGLTLAIGVLVVSTGCSSGGGGESLQDALGSIANNEGTRAYLEYGSLGAITQKTGMDTKALARSRFTRLYGFATGPLSQYGEAKVKADTGIDLTTATSVVSAGAPPKQAVVLYGPWDADAIGKKFGKLKRTSREEAGGTMWVYNEQPAMEPDKDPLFKPYVNNFNMTYVSAGKVAYSPSREGISQVVDVSSATLADSEPHQKVASCLGDVVAAAIITPKQSKSLAAIGVGVRVESMDKATDVACLLLGSGVQPATVGETVEQRLGQDPFNRVFTSRQVTVDEDAGVVEVTATSAKVGAVFTALNTGDLEKLVR